jgi:hypothetical protein
MRHDEGGEPPMIVPRLIDGSQGQRVLKVTGIDLNPGQWPTGMGTSTSVASSGMGVLDCK